MLRRAAGVAGTIVMLAAAVAVVPQRGKADSTKDVRVVNPLSQPVPVTGSVALGGTANVNVTNTPDVNVASLPAVQLAAGTTVGINGTPNVNVANQPTVALAPGAIVGALNANALQPVRKQVEVQFNDGDEGGRVLAYTVPAGKRFVLEDLSGNAFLPSGQKLVGVSFGLGDGPNTFVHLTPTPTGPDAIAPQDLFEFGRLARAYVEPGDTSFVDAARSSTSGIGGVFVTITGYLIDL